MSIDMHSSEMKIDFRRTHTTVTMMNYHFVWIVRRRRKVLTGAIKKQAHLLIEDASKQIDCIVLSLALEPDHVHLFLNAPHDLAIPKIMHKIKGYSARHLRQEFEELRKLPSMWTRSYFCSTAGNVAADTIKKYIEAQGKD